MPADLERVLSFFLRPQGRISRAEYALGIALIYALSLAALTFAFARVESTPVFLLVMPFTAPLTVALFILVVKRCHDLGLPGSFVLLLIVPVVGIVWLIALCFVPGPPAPTPTVRGLSFGPADRRCFPRPRLV